MGRLIEKRLRRCKKCGHQWLSRGSRKPQTCANYKCRSAWWHTKRSPKRGRPPIRRKRIKAQ